VKGEKNGKGEGGRIWSKYFVYKVQNTICIQIVFYLYDNRIIKPVEIVLRSGRREEDNDGRGESDRGTLSAHTEMSHETTLYN
jgi:hypothetical protein